jgi:hypothetical protein
MDSTSALDVVIVAVAACLVSVGALVLGLLDPLLFVAAPLVQPLLSAVPFDSTTMTTVLFVGVPLVLSTVVFARAARTRAPTDIVLGALAAPCLLAAAWALSGALSLASGVSVSGLVSLGVGTVLAVAVLSDAVLARVTSPSGV